MLALMPVLLFAYLGQFSRMFSDDYCIVALGKKLGAWEALDFYFSTWTSSYSRIYVASLLAGLDTLLSPLTPLVIILIWHVGLIWLLNQAFRQWGLKHSRGQIALALSATIIAASIHALYSLQSFYWFIASTAYTLPLALLILYLGMTFETGRRSRSNLPLALFAVGGAVICFISAGASEMFLVFQLLALSFLTAILYYTLNITERRPYLVLVGAGWVATCVSVIVHLNSPGISVRMANDALNIVEPVRELTDLVFQTIDFTFRYAGHQPAFAGFMMLLGVGFFASLSLCPAGQGPVERKSVNFAVQPLLLGLIIQLCFLPILWTHTSDTAQVFGRFSNAFMIVICLNGSLIVAFALLVWQRDRVSAAVKQNNGMMIYCFLVLVIVGLLFTLTQIRSIHYKAATFLFSSSLVFLIMLSWQLASQLHDPRAKTFGVLATIASFAALISIAALVCVSLFGHGFVADRILAPASFMQVVSGLVWGAYIGFLIQQTRVLTAASMEWIKWFKLLSFLLAFAIGALILVGHGKLAPDFASFAREWDHHHQEIIRQRESGNTTVSVPDYAFDLASYAGISTIFDGGNNRCPKLYYGVESIQLVES